MDRLPEEIILHILSICDVPEIVTFQFMSRRYRKLARDNTLWKIRCFTHSRAEALRRRQQLLSRQPSHLRDLRNALMVQTDGGMPSGPITQIQRRVGARSSADSINEANSRRTRALANWEPGYPGEDLDYYEDYIHRHAPINVKWIDLPKASPSNKETFQEATGVGVLQADNGVVEQLVSPLDDGSICIWDVSEQHIDRTNGAGRLLHHTRAGLLSGQPCDALSASHAIMTEVGAIECVSVNNASMKAHFAVQSLLHEVDLHTMQIISTKPYPFPITALSEAKDNIPVTVGTNWTVHLWDPRDWCSGGSSPATGELIGGSVYSHATLAQPGPLAILHDPGVGADDSSIWVAGRFTSLLNYDRRNFPRVRGTIHSGARIAALSSLPYPLVPQNLNLLRHPEVSISALTEARSKRGTTILAAAEYKLKGSLELYGLPRVQPFQNRQTASASKLLSVAPHGGRIVFSDGDGNLKWVERDGFTHVRTFNLADAAAVPDADIGIGDAGDASAHGIWSSTASEMPGQGEIVQKIVPTHPITASAVSSRSERADINQSNLILWTGDGRLGMLGFGHRNPLDRQDGGALEEQALSAEQRAREDAERQYGMRMRRALERNADEVRFVRGLGMGFMRDGV